MPILSLNSVKRFVFALETDCLFKKVGPEFLYTENKLIFVGIMLHVSTSIAMGIFLGF